MIGGAIGHVCLATRCTIAAVLVMVLPSAAAGQRWAQPRPGWIAPVQEGGFPDDLTAAQRAAALGVLERIEAILLQVPQLASPQGFEIMPQVMGGHRGLIGPGDTEVSGGVVTYSYSLIFFHPTAEIAGEGGSCVNVTVNFADVTEVMSPGNWFRDEQGRYLYYEPWREVPRPFATQVLSFAAPNVPKDERTNLVILTSGGERYWKTVTRQEYYEAMLFLIEGTDGAELTAMANAVEKTPYQLWVEEAAQRRAEREVALRAAAQAQPPPEVAALRKQLEDFEREMTEALRAAEAADRARADAAIAGGLGGDRIRAELAAMTPAERNMPALIGSVEDGTRDATGATMADRDTQRVQRVLAHDLDFWRARRSPVEVRSIAITLIDYGTCEVPTVRNAVLQVLAKLDWEALSGLLAPPR